MGGGLLGSAVQVGGTGGTLDRPKNFYVYQQLDVSMYSSCFSTAGVCSLA